MPLRHDIIQGGREFLNYELHNSCCLSNRHARVYPVLEQASRQVDKRAWSYNSTNSQPRVWVSGSFYAPAIYPWEGAPVLVRLEATMDAGGISECPPLPEVEFRFPGCTAAASKHSDQFYNK